MKKPIPIAEQLQCAREILAARQRHYGAKVQAGLMKQRDALLGVARVEAICATLERQKLLSEVSAEMLANPKPEPQPTE